MQTILFLCTGNYYRSRFAEEYFNHLSEKKNLSWQAHSKGLSLNMPNPKNPGPISIHVLKVLDKLNIQGKQVVRTPMPIEDNDFNIYDKIIALSDQEHRPMLVSRFNHHVNKVHFFEVGDLPVEKPDKAMTRLAELIENLTENLDK